MAPLIGIVVCGITQEGTEQASQFVSSSYIRAIEQTQGIPLLLPAVAGSAALLRYSTLCDGFLFCGGNDVTPLLFGEEPRHHMGCSSMQVDRFQMDFMQCALQSGKPILAICRGMQILNLVLGGGLYLDLTDCPHAVLNHMQVSVSRQDVSHWIQLSSQTQLRQLLGAACPVNSFHHQAIRQTGYHLTAAAHSSDGIIEAIESVSHPFVIGVQWHPEWMYSDDSGMRSLFQTLISKSENPHHPSL